MPDSATIAALHWLEEKLGRKCGGSTGTNLIGALTLAADMLANGENGSIVTLICDSGDRYLDTYYDDTWIESERLDPEPYEASLKAFEETGVLAFD